MPWASLPQIPREQFSLGGSSWPKANGDSLLQSRGVYYLSKVPSIWRVPPSRPGHEQLAKP